MVWTRSDKISAGSLVIALLALLYGPVKDYQTAQSVPWAHVKITKMCEKEEDQPSANSTQESLPGQPPREVRPDEPALPRPTPQVPAPTGMLYTDCDVQSREPSKPEETAYSRAPRIVDFDRVQIEGISDNVPADRDMWIVLRPEDDGRYYPVARARKLGSGAWNLGNSPLGLVQIPKAGVTYDIFAYMADSQASRQLATWNEREGKKPREEYEGMPSLPPNLILLGSVSIERPI